MKCLSLWQPWASLVVIGAKRFETRSWPTNYRGPLLIHAAQRWSPSQPNPWNSARNWSADVPIRIFVSFVFFVVKKCKSSASSPWC